MRRRFSIVKATALEILSEPLSLLILMSALTLSVFASAFHYHQFGDPTRMARDAGLSVMLLGSLPFVVFGAVRSMRREIECSTVQMALVRPVTRGGFFIAKCCGAAAAYFLFAATVALNTLAVVRGAEIGGELVAGTGAIARIWGVSLAFSTASVIMPLALAALLNRFASFRFVLTAMTLMPLFALVASIYRFNPALASRYLPVAFLAAVPAMVFLVVAAAAAVRLKAGQAVSVCGLFVLLSLPAMGNYYLSETLAKGGSMDVSYGLWAVSAAFPAIAAALLAGVYLMNSKDVA